MSKESKLTPERQMIVDTFLKNIDEENSIWKAGWITTEAPVSATTGKKYNGINNLALTLTSMARGYTDNRWLTYNQMIEKGWKFKTDENGKGLGAKAGVGIEFYELRDRETNKPFDRSSLDGMTEDEKHDYYKDNVYTLRKHYCVFNGDLIDGIPEKEKRDINPDLINERAESFIKFWSDKESKIIYGGDSAYYSPKSDEIHVPKINSFYDMTEYYGTTLHEIGHSTGHEKRLNRSLLNDFGSSDYALEELRAEIASMFMAQDFGLGQSESHIKNNRAYLKSWKDSIQDNPNALFDAIIDAQKIATFVQSKEKENKRRNVEHYAIVNEMNNQDRMVYSVYMVAPYGQVTKAMGMSFDDIDALNMEFSKMQQMPFWKGKEFQKVSYEELTQISINQAEAENVEEQKSDKFISPDEVVAKNPNTARMVDMKGRGKESLTRMSDRDVLEEVLGSKNGEKASALYNGLFITGNEEQDERTLMIRIAFKCGDDKDRLMRIFKSSGQYRDEKPNAYYEKMADGAMEFCSGVLKKFAPPPPAQKGNGKANFGMNAKT